MACSGLNILKDNENLIVNTVNIVHLLPYLPSWNPLEHGVNRDRATPQNIKEAYFEYVKGDPAGRVFQAFKDALLQAGMTKIYNLLDNKKVKDERVFTELVLKHDHVMRRVDWHALIDRYYAERRLEISLKSQLMELYDKYGWASIVTYLSTTEDWFYSLIKCLKDLKESAAVNALNRLLLITNSDDSLRRIINDMTEGEAGKALEEEKMSLRSYTSNDHLYSYLKIFGAAIYDANIDSILEHLYSSKIISQYEYGAIKMKETSIWKYLLLLDHLKTKNCLVDFIIALQTCQERRALDALDIEMDDDEITIEKKIARLIDDNRTKRQTGECRASDDADGDQSDLQFDAVAKQLSSPMRSDTASTMDRSSPEMDDIEESSNTDTQSYNFLEDDQISKAEEEGEALKESAPILNKLKFDGLQGKSSQEVQEYFDPFWDCIEGDSRGRKLISIERDGTVMVEFKESQYAHFTMEALKSSICIMYAEQDVVKQSAGTSSSASLPSRLPSDVEFKLRSYQMELAGYALSGKNCIIVAPTGSGKTHVAIYIIMEHFRRSRKNKVLFVVPTVALVEQQKKQVEHYSAPNQGLGQLKVCGLSGSSELDLHSVFDNYDVFVLTPQIVINQLMENPLYLTFVTLIIFDECHHTNKDHPYNLIMSNYISKRQEDRHNLPQIVGLTASIGVGKSKSMKDAVKHVSLICANLDCPTIRTVDKNQKELQLHVNKPEEDTLEVCGRRSDPFHEEANNMMANIERRMMVSTERCNAEREISTFTKDINPPSERGNDPYTQWLSKLRKNVCTIHKQDTRMFYITMIDYLIMFNNSLVINAYCRTKDALDYVDDKMSQGNYSFLPLPDGLNEKLVNEWKGKSARLKLIADNPEYRNPKLEKIRTIISEYYKSNADSRCIIFCKTRDTASALVNWMKETPDLKHLNPTKLVGTNAPSNKSGMTSVQQDSVLKFFKNGEHKILIATSIAEEGLDVQKCNIVIRYEHVTNSIARVQTRGRARKDNAKYVLVAEKGSGAAEKEMKNSIREEMMKKAIVEFQNLGFQERMHIIDEIQSESLVGRQLSDSGKQISNALKKQCLSEDEFEIRCIKCDQFAAMSSHIRKIEESHHVIIDSKIKDRIEIKPYPKSAPLSQSFKKTGKIFCGKCQFDWGIMALYNNVPFPVIKIRSFVIKNGMSQLSFNQWKDVPFSVTKLGKEDLQASQIFSYFKDDKWNEINISDSD